MQTSKQRFVVDPDEFVGWLREQRNKANDYSLEAAEKRSAGKTTKYSPAEYEVIAKTLNTVLDKVWATGKPTELPPP
jgi:hypothetical protein